MELHDVPLNSNFPENFPAVNLEFKAFGGPALWPPKARTTTDE